MKKGRFTSVHHVSVLVASLGLTAFSCFAQTKAMRQPEKSSDAAIHWQFDTKG